MRIISDWEDLAWERSMDETKRGPFVMIHLNGETSRQISIIMTSLPAWFFTYYTQRTYDPLWHIWGKRVLEAFQIFCLLCPRRNVPMAGKIIDKYFYPLCDSHNHNNNKNTHIFSMAGSSILIAVGFFSSLTSTLFSLGKDSSTNKSSFTNSFALAG